MLMNYQNSLFTDLRMYDKLIKCVKQLKAYVSKAGLDPVLASHYQNQRWLLVYVTKWEEKQGERLNGEGIKENNVQSRVGCFVTPFFSQKEREET